MSKVFQISLNEIRLTLRTQGSGWLAGLILGVGLFCILTGYSRYEDTSHKRQHSSELMRKQFLSQGQVNPHSAAHYGHFVFKPHSFLTIIDPGIEKYVGVSLQLEGHQQNDIQFAPSQKASSLIRFGELSFSLLLQIILPLLIFFVVHRTMVSERQQGTLKLLVAQGLSVRQIIWGKILGFTVLAFAVLLFITLIFISIISFNDVSQQSADLLIRTVALLGIYAAYYFLLIALTVLLSAKTQSSASALVTILSLWLLLAVIIPKFSANLGEQLVSLPSKLSFDKQISEANRQGINGHDPRDKRSQRIKDSLLLHYKVDSIENLPVNADGIIMQADEQYHNVVYDKQFASLRDAIRAQDRYTNLTAVLDPALTVQHLSMALAGTDIFHHFRFLDQAENYRRFLIKKLNDDMAYGGSRTGDWDWSVDKDYWQKINDFTYSPPTFQETLCYYKWELSAFIFWIFATFLLVHWAAPRLDIL
ncbi:DUF3526 domain-containing protein [Dyadobacter sp. 32]|uniref:ABC transporter permease n=1 Tax=Dyadobacter sp. 32 TaxID=538966 RepID=UPI0011ECD59E